MGDANIKIEDVSDTALWVAHYRAQETERPDALFRDPFAKVLVGDRGARIAAHMKKIGRYTQWSIVSRTVIIDRFIQNLLKEGVDTVVNLGAGLDTRPYRMNLPKSLKWIEVDYPKIIQLKSERLKKETPQCDLRRIALDLADDEKRRDLFAEINASGKKILVITEGVIPYLTPAQVRALGDDLHAQPHMAYWITEFFTPEVYKYLKHRVRTKKMQNAPFQFYPDDWNGFFAQSGWTPQETRFGSEIAKETGRKVPMPWFAFVFKIFASKAVKERSSKMSGYMVFKRS